MESGYGGSRKISGMACAAASRGDVRQASALTTREQAAASSEALFLARAANASRSRSKKVQRLAPRERASNPIVPPPEKTSATGNAGNDPAHPKCEASIEKIASLTRSGIGRVARPPGRTMVRDRHFPAMIRMRPFSPMAVAASIPAMAYRDSKTNFAVGVDFPAGVDSRINVSNMLI